MGSEKSFNEKTKGKVWGTSETTWKGVGQFEAMRFPDWPAGNETEGQMRVGRCTMRRSRLR